MMPVECARVKATFVVEGEHIERGPNDANRLAAKKLNDNLGHAHPMAGIAVALFSDRIVDLSKRPDLRATEEANRPASVAS
ncbi:MAG: hypothetical protein M3436_07870 [Pseudomonadota bacterium]|nr:hypothetical protein [Pseudomonadota bacterium]